MPKLPVIWVFVEKYLYSLKPGRLNFREIWDSYHSHWWSLYYTAKDYYDLSLMMGIYFHWSRKCGERTLIRASESRECPLKRVLYWCSIVMGKDCVKLCRLKFPCLFSQIPPHPTPHPPLWTMVLLKFFFFSENNGYLTPVCIVHALVLITTQTYSNVTVLRRSWVVHSLTVIFLINAFHVNHAA